MDFEKVCSEFEKRYNEKCGGVYFLGRPIKFFAYSGGGVYASVLPGGFAAVRKRGDDRVNLQFSSSRERHTLNLENIEKSNDESIAEFFLRLKASGVDVSGADILLGNMPKMPVRCETLLIYALDGFCRTMSGKINAAKIFDDYEENTAMFAARENTVVIKYGEKISYAPLLTQKVKIVLSRIPDADAYMINSQYDDAQKAVNCLLRRDYEGFGSILNLNTAGILTAKKQPRKTRRLFETALELGDAFGSGLLEDGGIFSVVENEKVDVFMRNLSREYKMYRGASPEFYVTTAVGSAYRRYD